MRALAAALLVSISAARPASADSAFARAAVEQGRQLAIEAGRHYQDGRFVQALDAYRRAYDVAPVPELLFNIGQCHFQLKSYEWAIFFYQGYLADRPRAGNRALVESLITESRRHLKRRTASPLFATRAPAADTGGEASLSAAPAERESPAIYRRWWFWTAVGVAAVAAGGTAYYLHDSSGRALPDRSLGTVDGR
jgi:tetratricopeptide (TPR) repeat protein